MVSNSQQQANLEKETSKNHSSEPKISYEGRVNKFQFTRVKLTKKLAHYCKIVNLMFYHHFHFRFITLQNCNNKKRERERERKEKHFVKKIGKSRFLSLLLFILFQLFHKIRVDTGHNEVVPVTEHPLA